MAGFRKSPAGALLSVNYSGDRAGTLSIVPGPAAAGAQRSVLRRPLQ